MQARGRHDAHANSGQGGMGRWSRITTLVSGITAGTWRSFKVDAARRGRR
jgi:hypothetical protein